MERHETPCYSCDGVTESESDWSSVILAFHGQADIVQSTTFQTSGNGLVHMAGQILGNIFTPTNCNI